MKKSFFQHFLVISSGTLISMCIGLFTTPIITRLVDPDQYGILSLFTMYSSIILMVCCIGLDQALVRYYYNSTESEYKTSIFYKCAILPIVLGCGCALCLIFLKYLGIDIFNFSWSELLCFCFYMILQIINRFSVLLLRLEYKSSQYTIVNIVNKVSYIVLALFFLKLLSMKGVTPLIYATVIAYLIATLLSLMMGRDIWLVKKNKKTVGVTFRELIKYGSPFILSMGITTLFQYLDKISLSLFCGYEEVGIYASASSLIAVFALVQSTFNTLWSPMSIEHFERDPDDRKYYIKVNEAISFVMLGIGICLLASSNLIVLLLGEKYRKASTIIPFLMFNPIMYTISETTVNGIVFMKKSQWHIITALGACLTNIVGNILLVPIFAGEGAAISTGLSYIVFFTLRTLLSNKVFYINFKLKKFYLVLSFVVIYAFYCTFFNNTMIIIFGGVIELIVLFFAYRSVCREGILLIKDRLRRWKKC